jgi:hypothetical protein
MFCHGMANMMLVAPHMYTACTYISRGARPDQTFTYILPSSSSWAGYTFRFFAG